MKKYFLLFSVFILGLSACNKVNITTQQAQIDDEKIQAYMLANKIVLTKDPAGYYYKVITPGTGAAPTLTNTVKVTYTGTFLDGQGFDSEASVSFVLNTNAQLGLQYGIQRISPGGRIMLILPSALGFGTSGNGGNVPANSVLIYTVDLQGYF
jgi:FKBP-type peptidyl-prolyl cis-trans isomerase FkpA